MDYYAGGTLETESKESPDVLPAMVHTPAFGSGGAGAIPHLGIYTGRSLNSSIIMDSVNDSTSEVVGEAEDNEELKPMPAFVFHAGKLDYGTILNHDAEGNKLWNYTLAYHGPDGLFERFWRNYDSLLRNSLLEIKASMLLSDIQKVSLSEYRKVTIEGQELLPSAIQYSRVPGNPWNPRSLPQGFTSRYPRPWPRRSGSPPMYPSINGRSTTPGPTPATA